ncbi:CAP domain-containing protein [Umezakia ovalisporum]|uniref:CAP domain-containing protein n=1 Tax=Umezakia ovalisporum TaxID=75695 RepID=UPI0035B9B2C3
MCPTSNQIEIAIRERINELREEKQLHILKHNEKLAQVAGNYSRQMAEKNFFSHIGINGSTLQDRVSDAEIMYWVIGENLFKGTNVPQPVKVAFDG